MSVLLLFFVACVKCDRKFVYCLVQEHGLREGRIEGIVAVLYFSCVSEGEGEADSHLKPLDQWLGGLW
jgi:hypothetical protein